MLPLNCVNSNTLDMLWITNCLTWWRYQTSNSLPVSGTDMLLRRFGRCSVSVKLSVFRAYSLCFHAVGQLSDNILEIVHDTDTVTMENWQEVVCVVHLTAQSPVNLSDLDDHFLQRAQCSHCKRCISYGNSVRPSVRLSVCPSVRPSHAGIVSKRRHVARCSLHRWIAKCV